MTAPDPMKGLRGIFAATLVLESIVVLLVLLLPGVEGVASGIVTALAGSMLVAAGLQRRSWGLGVALALQVATVVGWLVVSELGLVGLIFALVWAFLLYLRWDVARRMGRGELPGQQV